jgi:hypothetical protein
MRSHRALTGAALAAACMILQCALPERVAAAAPLDPGAYGITAGPQAGPVTSFQPVKSLAPVPFALLFDWGMNPYNDRTWWFRLHTLRIVDGALAAGDFAYASEVFLDWQRWHDNCWLQFFCFGRSAERAWHDMATGIRASRLAYLLRSTGWQDQRLVKLAEQHAEKLQDPAFVADYNHGVFQLHGLAALCIDKKLSKCQHADRFLERELAVLLQNQFTDSGVHRENSPAYHFFMSENLWKWHRFCAPSRLIMPPFSSELVPTPSGSCTRI